MHIMFNELHIKHSLFSFGLDKATEGECENMSAIFTLLHE